MAFFTKSEAYAAAERKPVAKSDNTILCEAAASALDTDSFDIFLSHSMNDAALVRGVMRMLEDQALKVYVDWMVDPQLKRSSVTKETAALLRRRMTQCQSLIYVSTVNASSSKWMPWELGYFDGLKKGNVAIMPLLENENDPFSGQEYLGLYPLVEKARYTNDKKVVVVKEPKVKWSTLASFAKGGPKWINL